jgi:hypothetical protein
MMRLRGRLARLEAVLAATRLAQDKRDDPFFTDPWFRAANRIFVRLPEEQRQPFVDVMYTAWVGGAIDGWARYTGLRSWVDRHVSREEQTWSWVGWGFLPPRLPVALLDAYLTDAKAQPRHDCADCGLIVPVHGDWEWEQRQRMLFQCCPHCGGPIGARAYFHAHGAEYWELNPLADGDATIGTLREQFERSRRLS